MAANLYLPREDGGGLVSRERNPLTLWIEEGSIPCLLWDGEEIIVRNGQPYRRLLVPLEAVNKEMLPDDAPEDGMQPILQLLGEGIEDAALMHAWNLRLFGEAQMPEDWRYWALGPGIHDNPYGYDLPIIIHQAAHQLSEPVPTDYASLVVWLRDHPRYFGIVWWQNAEQTCKKAQITQRDVGHPWPPQRL